MEDDQTLSETDDSAKLYTMDGKTKKFLSYPEPRRGSVYRCKERALC